jgi:hypothetical protein
MARSHTISFGERSISAFGFADRMLIPPAASPTRSCERPDEDLLEISKTLNYLDSPNIDPYLALFILFWVYMRHYHNPSRPDQLNLNSNQNCYKRPSKCLWNAWKSTRLGPGDILFELVASPYVRERTSTGSSPGRYAILTTLRQSA